MKEIVVDASTAGKWYFQEKHAEKANVLFQQIRERLLLPVVPELFFSEMTSICWKRVLRKEIPPSEGQAIYKSLTRLPFQTRSDKEFADVAFENALIYGTSVYDALYLSVAETYLIPFVTADEKLLRACKGKFEYIEYLGDYSVA